ncbi:hypothetical protein LX15_004133 [Streptoalloteichus tenebrarius]|uniref:DUF3592 domain-containing protein n=1 Tax=Streptoalloteichus tenebrarius (strain ATCC 17920 / DSM 40477 / JCM 4838 / CBS 697.72 / NBRC 16177 / NCIMB 11028 / NRRL B-12390 / A12253. 1 / ISP 5477) TaxID=1933 RepID=A0ABT1HY16_STRSD|nr:hypothetical protein [Streptoalloteichus tenebrarius]
MDERPAPRARTRRGWRRVTAAALVTVGTVLSALCVLLVIGCWLDDRAIERPEPGRATAEVVLVSFPRTVVRYTTPDGAVYSPSLGVLYPEGLQTGQLVRVEYDPAQPDKLVRVAGRDFRIALLPAGTTVLGIWLVVVPLVWWLRRSAR